MSFTPIRLDSDEKGPTSYEIGVILLGFFSTTPLIRAFDVSVFVYLLAGFSIFLLLKRGFTHLSVKGIFPFLISCIASTMSAILSSIPSSYIANSTKALIAVFLIWVVGELSLKESPRHVRLLIKGVCLGGMVNALWMVMQWSLGAMWGLDLNRMVFHDLLHMASQTSQYKQHGLVPTGLCWNVGGVASSLLLLFCLSRSHGVRLIVVFAAVISHSRTLQIGILVAVCLLLIPLLSRCAAKLSPKMRRVLLGVTLGCGMLLIVVLVAYVMSKIPALDTSGAAHLGYYLNLPELTASMNGQRLMIGYGVDCSGLPYTDLTGQYHWLDSWFVESDPVNTFLGNGLLGLATLYGFLFTVAWRCIKVRSRATVFIAVLIVCGVFYNLLSVTYYWVLLVLSAFYFCPSADLACKNQLQRIAGEDMKNG